MQQTQVFQLGCVVTPILGGLDPLPGRRRTRHLTYAATPWIMKGQIAVTIEVGAVDPCRVRV